MNLTTAGRSVEPARACGKSLLENPTRTSLKHLSPARVYRPAGRTLGESPKNVRDNQWWWNSQPSNPTRSMAAAQQQVQELHMTEGSGGVWQGVPARVFCPAGRTLGESPKQAKCEFGRNSQPSDPSRTRRQPNSECTLHNADGSGGVWQGGQGLNPTQVPKGHNTPSQRALAASASWRTNMHEP